MSNENEKLEASSAQSENPDRVSDKPQSGSLGTGISHLDRSREIAARPRRPLLLHWLAFVLALVSLSLPAFWLTRSPSTQFGPGWVWLDVGLSVFFAFEFLTRSGLRWNWSKYVRTHIFEIIAIIPFLALVHFGVDHLVTWAWFILVARFARALDRLLGDGFLQRNVLVLLEGFEEEITDRVLLRIIARVQDDLARGQFGRELAKALAKNKEPVLKRIRDEHPQHGMRAGIARVIGLESAIEQAEARVYDSMVEVIGSAEIDRAIRESVDSLFSEMREQIDSKSWRKKLGMHRAK